MGSFIEQIKTRSKRDDLGATSSRRLFAYKITPDLNVTKPGGFFSEMQQSSTAIQNPNSGDISSYSGTLSGQGSTSGAIFIDVAASRDEEGVVPHRG